MFLGLEYLKVSSMHFQVSSSLVIQYLKICSRYNTLDEVCTLQVAVLEVAVPAVSCCEVAAPQILREQHVQ